jgi:drug/metabolite transporter (DMT)-like permease
MHAAGKADALWGSLVFRLAAALIVLVTVIVRRPPLRVGGRNLWIVVGVGVGDTLGNVLFAGSASHGLVSLTSVLASLYPVITVALAAVTLNERVAGLQRVGIVLTLTGVALISV